MTILLVIGLLVFDREEMIWTYLVWLGMVLVIAIDYWMGEKKKKS